jgi:hypothetical protein
MGSAHKKDRRKIGFIEKYDVNLDGWFRFWN